MPTGAPSLFHTHTERQAQPSLYFGVGGFCSNQGRQGVINPLPLDPGEGCVSSACVLGCLLLPLLPLLWRCVCLHRGSFVAHPVAVPMLPRVEVTGSSPALRPQKPELVKTAKEWKPAPWVEWARRCQTSDKEYTLTTLKAWDVGPHFWAGGVWSR